MTGRTERILITGLGGAVGTELGTVLPGAVGDAELVAVFSSEKSRDRFLAGADTVLRAILRTEVCDLRDAAAVAGMGARLHRVDRTAVVHVAANTSWTLPLETACRFNVDATRNVAELARRTSDHARMIYVSSAFTATEKAHPADRPPPAPVFVSRHTVGETSGKLHIAPYRVNVGLRWAAHNCDVVRQGDHIAIFSGTTLIRTLTADPTRSYQPSAPNTRTYRTREPKPPS